jgi:putative tricarboxylic transport membrane protein
MFENILAGFANVLHPLNPLMLFSAIVLGFFGGAMPGISGITLIVILLPVTYGMDPIPVFVLLTAIYCATAFRFRQRDTL